MPGANQSALKVRPGCAVPASPASKSRSCNQVEELSPQVFIDGVRAGDRSLLARAITLAESSRAEDQIISGQILQGVAKDGGNSIRVGITGAPGAGKSSLIEALGKHIITTHHEKVAVLAIDPSSTLSGGSILGDKIRMPFLASSDQAFIRPSPSSHTHGGVGRHTREAMVLCEAAGYRNILVETVGVGQAETAVRELVDFVLLVAIPGAGDELQGIKRGIVELADLVAVNKADGESLVAAERARIDLENALHLLRAEVSGWNRRAVKCSAHSGTGIWEIWEQVKAFEALCRSNKWLQETRREQNRRAMHEVLEFELVQLIRTHPELQERMSILERRLIDGEIAVACAVRDLMAFWISRCGVRPGE